MPLIEDPQMDPLNIQILKADTTIKHDRMQEVTSSFIRSPSSEQFHPDGLFSELIFGQVATTERLVRFGYIDMHCKVFHPLIYENVCRLKTGLYEEIMAGKLYAIFNKETADFTVATIDDEGAETGFSFFMRCFPMLKFEKNNSLTRNDRIRIIEEYKEDLYVQRWLVIPAGIRDMNVENNRKSSSDINTLYLSLLNYSKAIPVQNQDHPVYDNIRFSIQKKIVEIYSYLSNLLDDKGGFLQRKYGARNLALGTANVVSAANMAAQSPLDPQFLKSTETKIPLYQAAKAFQPLVIFNMKLIFFNQIFDAGSDQIGVIDPETLTLEYQAIDIHEKDRFLSSEGLLNIIDLYQDDAMRHSPVVVHNEEGKQYYLFMIYDDVEDIYICRNITEFEKYYVATGKIYDSTKMRSIVYSELLYIATFRATQNKHCVITRYPALHIGSTYTSKIHLLSTDPSREVKIKSIHSELYEVLPEYPVIGRTSIDSLVLHPSRLSTARGLGADFDGDKCTMSPIISEEANAECDAYQHSIASIVSANGSLAFGGDSDLIALTFYNLSVRRDK